jgi:hypothetical protein
LTNSFCDNLGALSNFLDINRRQSPARSDRWGKGFAGLRWTPLHFAADVGNWRVWSSSVQRVSNGMNWQILFNLISSRLFCFHSTARRGRRSITIARLQNGAWSIQLWPEVPNDHEAPRMNTELTDIWILLYIRYSEIVKYWNSNRDIVK